MKHPIFDPFTHVAQHGHICTMRRRLSSILSMITLKRSRNAANLRARDFDHLRKNQRLPQDTLSRYQHKPTLVRNASSHSTDSLDVALKASLGRVCFQEPDLWHAPLSDHMVYLTQSFTGTHTQRIGMSQRP